MKAVKFMLQNGDTALHNAARNGHVEVVEILVKYGAAVDIRNEVFTAESGSTCLTV